MKKAKWLCAAAAALAVSTALLAGCGGGDKKQRLLQLMAKAPRVMSWFILLFILISSIRCANRT
jgi:F0F1-type ATP synthase membrane subunit c/vacuolar-type H+-ATPase subunit K